MGTLEPVIVVIATALAAFALTWIILKVLRQRQILDHPNERSSHKNPTPRGGGIAVVAVVLAAAATIALLAKPAPAGLWPILAGAGMLAGISWLDDEHGKSELLRVPIPTRR